MYATAPRASRDSQPTALALQYTLERAHLDLKVLKEVKLKTKQKKREEMARELARAEGGEQSLVGPASPAPRQLFGPGGSPLFE